MGAKAKILMASGVPAVLIAVGLLVAQLVPRDHELGRFDVVATVNGEPIVYGELKQSMNAERSRISTYFERKYGARNDARFWTTGYGGEVPAEKLKHAALDRSVVIKLQQVAARQHGVIADIGYRTLVGDLNRYNSERRKMVQEGGVVFGPATYDEKRYFDERLQALRDGLKEKLGAPLDVSDQEVKRYYAENKRRFSLGYSRTIDGISFVAKNSAESDQLTRARTKLAELDRRMAAGATFDTIYGEVRHGGGILSAGERVHDYRTLRTDAMAGPATARAISDLDKGQVTGIVGDDRSVGIYKCVAKKSLGYSPVEQVRPTIVSELRDHKYDALVQRWRADAKVHVVDKAMKAATVE